MVYQKIYEEDIKYWYLMFNEKEDVNFINL